MLNTVNVRTGHKAPNRLIDFGPVCDQLSAQFTVEFNILCAQDLKKWHIVALLGL